VLIDCSESQQNGYKQWLGKNKIDASVELRLQLFGLPRWILYLIFYCELHIKLTSIFLPSPNASVLSKTQNTDTHKYFVTWIVDFRLWKARQEQVKICKWSIHSLVTCGGEALPGARRCLLSCSLQLNCSYARARARTHTHTHTNVEISASQNGEFEDGCLLGHSVVLSVRSLQTFQRCLPPPGGRLNATLSHETARFIQKLFIRNLIYNNSF
jgi:hypothetical protein